ncbi:MAG: HlyD family type I secretion periplasmic adaptor subunit [Gammaproteobacteria bacterium]|nr:HlyD family type I secretion periplasmic adaptor subunit [Gammaproteobacteria bacterium]
MPRPDKHATATPGTALDAMRPVARAGLIIVLVFFAGLGSWAAIAPLQSAALGPGVLNVESQRKTLQHLEGGIVGEILVSEGDGVSRGQLLIRLDRTQAKANLAQLEIRHHALRALEARLIAERDGRDDMAPTSPTDNAELAKAIESEINVFSARRRSLEGEEKILRQRILQFEEEIAGLKGQIAAQTTQLKLIDEELNAQKSLYERRLVGMQRIIELKRERSEIIGDRNRERAAIARIKQNIGEEELKILELTTSRLNDSVGQLTEVQTTLADVRERLVAARDVLERTDVTAPLDGHVVDLRVHTVGGVIGAGEALMDIVPLAERLVVDARVNPMDIDSIHPGMTARVVLTAFNRRTVAPVDGVVLSVSADSLTDSRTGAPYYLARVELPEDALAEQAELELSPGMHAEVMIITGEQTALQYLYQPVARSFSRAMREQ